MRWSCMCLVDVYCASESELLCLTTRWQCCNSKVCAVFFTALFSSPPCCFKVCDSNFLSNFQCFPSVEADSLNTVIMLLSNTGLIVARKNISFSIVWMILFYDYKPYRFNFLHIH